MNEVVPDGARVIGRYALHAEIAAGGMAKVHLGRLIGPVGFARTVAIKRLHAHLARDPEFVAMFLDEARLAARIRHPNVVTTLDVVALEGEIFLVLEYVLGEPLSRLIVRSVERDEHIPTEIVASIILGVLEGLHAAHEARSEGGAPLGIVHRDVSPQNVIVGVDGVARVLDFGIAKATVRIQETQDGQLKGKMAYVSPEQAIGAKDVDRRADVWAAGVVLWETLTRRRLFHAEGPVELLRSIESGPILPPSRMAPCSTAFDAIVLRALERDPEKRFPTAREMALAVESASKAASARAVGEWVERTATASLAARAARVEEMERATKTDPDHRPSQTVRSRLAALGVESPIAADVTEGTARPATRDVDVTGPARGRQPTSEPPAPTMVAVYSQREGGAQVTEKIPIAKAAPSSLPPSAPPAPRKSARSWPAVVVIALLVTGLGGVAAMRQRETTAARETREPLAQPSAAPTITTIAPPVASTLPSSSPSPSPSSPSSPASSAHGRHAPRRPATLKGPACDPPYTIGPAPDFIRKPKPECFPD